MSRGGDRAGTTTTVALLSSRGKFMVAEPFFPPPRGDGGNGRPASPRQVPVERSRDARPGMLVLLESRGRGRPRVLRVLGSPDNARVVLEGLMLHRGLSRRFPPGVAGAADAAGRTNDDDERARRDIRDLPTFTIDPATAKDFDDAISAERLGKGRCRVWVHIADVSAFVTPGSTLDREANRRSTSVYIPGSVEPMLPPVLSNGVCSLIPGEDRKTVTVEMAFDGPRVTEVSFYRSLIRSDRRYDYEEVDELFDSGAELEPSLAAARAVSAGLEARRLEQRVALAIESVEPEFEFDAQGDVAAVHSRVQTESHRLIEHLMIAANEQVAKLLSEKGVPTLFRTHEPPKSASVRALLDKLESLGVPTPPAPEEMSSSEAARIQAEASQMVVDHVRRTGTGRKGLTSLLLRSLQQAVYQPVDRGHAGLGLRHYCHFTSPIRRYPDLVAHRALLSAVGAGDGGRIPRGASLEQAGEWTSARERDAMSIERDADDIARCFLMQRVLKERGWETIFDGEVAGLIGAGAFVAFGDGFEGMVPVRRLGGGEWWDLNEEGTILFGSGEGAIRLGDPIRVRVVRVDIPRGRIDLDRVSDDAPGERDVTSRRHGQRQAQGRGR